MMGFLFMKHTVESVYSYFQKHPEVSTDTRSLKEGALFFALKGPNFDANKLVLQALEQGAAYAVADDAQLPDDPRILKVEDSQRMLQELGQYHRRKMKAKVIGITGTNGKTTTKELMARVLASSFNIVFTEGNLNNHLGVPLSLLRINEDTDIAVIEMGANHMGEIMQLCRLAEPDFGIITNIGKAHLEGFGSFQGVINSKSELYAYIDDHAGMLFVNTDNQLLDRLSKNIKRFTFGSSMQADVYGQLIEADPFVQIDWEYGSNQMTVESRLIGNYNAENILAAIAVGCHFNVPAEKINHAISSYIPSNNRSQLVETSKNRVIMDAYNANPVSMELAIKNFDSIRHSKAMLILGDMLELGQESDAEHAEILKLLSDLEMPEVILVGPHFERVYAGDDWLHFEKVEQLCSYFEEKQPKSYDILIKGSRGIRLEKVLPYL